MKPIKVRHREAYKDGDVDIVCKGKLVLIKQEKDIIFPCISSNLADSDWCILNGLVRSPRYYYKPIIISETEPITENTKTVNEGLNGDFYYNTIYKSIAQTGDITEYDFKVLALPDNFSPEHLQAIVNGTLKEGDEVLVECNYNYSNESVVVQDDGKTPQLFIRLNQDNHIKLFPVKKEYGWEKIDKEFTKSEGCAISLQCEKLFVWLKENYNPPIRK